jgi:hypothetical protein
MKKQLLVVSLALGTATAYALPDYDPFADASGSSGGTYTVGANLVGQVNAQGQTWYQAGPSSSTQPKLVSGNLSYPGLPTSQGNSVSFGGNGESARLNLSSVVGSGTVYFSFLLDVTSISGLSSSGVFWAGFNNSTGSQTTTPTTVATRIYTKTSGDGFVLGVDKNSGTTSDWYWDSTVHHTGETLFLVGGYTINSTSSTDDVSSLWINPDASTLGTGTAPAATVTAATGADITLSQVASFVLFDRSTAQPSGMIDELRIGTSWADVTSPLPVPEPTSLALIAAGLIGLLGVRRRASR